MRNSRAILAFLVFGIALGVAMGARAQGATQATCEAWLATDPNPAGIPAVTGPGVAQRSAFLAAGGKLVAIGSRYYTVSIPPGYYTAGTPVVVFDLHGTGGYPEAEWTDWNSSLAARGHAFIGLAWGGGTPGASTDEVIYAQLKQILQEVGASCPVAGARKWLLGFSVGSAMSFAIMVRDVADQKAFRGQVAVSGAAIGPLTTGIAVLHATVEAAKGNGTAVQGIKSWMYCGELDLDHGWSMCLEMPYGESFVNTHGGAATLYRDPTGTHHSLPANATARGQMLDFLVANDPFAANPATLDFGGQSMNTTSPGLPVTLANNGAAAVTVSAVAASGDFAVTHDCTTVAAGASCTATVTFTPAAQGALAGTLTITTGSGAQTVALAGTGEKSLVTHYYRAILRRAPDAAGKAYWDGEAARVQALGVNVNEVWYAMAGSFFGSAEYLAFNRDNDGFVTDLYTTFFNRAPDAGGFADWKAQLAAGMPREVVLASFMFSAEFASFTQAIFGTTVTRKEVDTVVDFYRGLLGVLPDNSGFNYWLGLFRTAQCQGGSAVNAQVETISSAFANSAEYGNRGRTNAQYVGDLYNAFLRRGAPGDNAGVQFWINQIATGARSRENVRQAFVASTEFQARVAAVAAAGCVSLGAPTVANVAATTIAAVAYQSSSKLDVAWQASGGVAATSYKVTAVDAVAGESVGITATGTSAQLTGLKSATTYSVSVAPCVTLATATVCYDSPVTATTVTTPSEVWHLQGSGRTVVGLTPIVSDGNVRISATRFGADAPADVAGHVQIYYGPKAVNPQALTVGVTSLAASAGNPASYLSFTSLASSSGLKSPASPATLVKQVATGQGVPLSASLGGKVRLYFEAQGADGKTRILHVDSADGYTGRDFHAGAPTQCSATADYEAGGGCAPGVAIGVEGDAVQPNAKILNARQNKVGWPVLDDWRWNGAAGTFMVFTTDNIAGCTTVNMNHGYALWDGAQWVVQADAGGCPKLFKGAQAMLPMHIGGARYKMYYGDTTDTTGRLNSQLPFLGPKKLIYASGAATGAATTVDYEDWEALSAGRDVVFLWPDGSPLDATAEGYIDDFHFLAPTGSLDLQVAYIAITDGVQVPTAVAAVLANP